MRSNRATVPSAHTLLGLAPGGDVRSKARAIWTQPIAAAPGGLHQTNTDDGAGRHGQLASLRTAARVRLAPDGERAYNAIGGTCLAGSSRTTSHW
jgi:hypothetical protein